MTWYPMLYSGYTTTTTKSAPVFKAAYEHGGYVFRVSITTEKCNDVLLY
jgi:hypothetical protein